MNKSIVWPPFCFTLSQELAGEKRTEAEREITGRRVKEWTSRRKRRTRNKRKIQKEIKKRGREQKRFLSQTKYNGTKIQFL